MPAANRLIAIPQKTKNYIYIGFHFESTLDVKWLAARELAPNIPHANGPFHGTLRIRPDFYSPPTT